MESPTIILITSLLLLIVYGWWSFRDEGSDVDFIRSQLQVQSVNLRLGEKIEEVREDQVQVEEEIQITTEKEPTPSPINQTPIKLQNPLALKNIQTRLIPLIDRPDLGLFFNKNASQISNKQQYAIISANGPEKGRKFDYYFNIPIACQAWRQIGFGCFIIIPYTKSEPEMAEIRQIVQDSVSSFGNDEYPGSIVILEMKIPEKYAEKTVQVAQVVRLFVGQILKYTVEKMEDFISIQNSIYLITTDVDLLPLSTKVFRDLSHDWQMVNAVSIDRMKDHVYVALSCIGASLGVWNFLVDKIIRDHFSKSVKSNEYFDAVGIIKVCEQLTNESLEEKPGTSKIAWYIDQKLASTMVRDYLDLVGWDKIHHRNDALDVRARINKSGFKVTATDWQNEVDRSLDTPYKDSHFCRAGYFNKCWWTIYHLLKHHMPVYDLRQLENYRFKMMETMLKMPEGVLHFKSRGYLIRDQETRDFYLNLGRTDPKIQEYLHTPKKYNKFEFRNLNRIESKKERKLALKPAHIGYDVSKIWTPVYPKIYSAVKPMFVDWQNERVFREWIVEEKTGEELFIYKVVPKFVPEYLLKKLLSGRKAKEMFFEK